MSSNVEERVVEMRFDNAKFEKNAQQTIKTLNALDKSLDLQGSTKGFEQLEKAANSVDLSHLEKSLDYLANKFTLFGKIGDKILTDLAHKFTNFFEKVSKSFTTDQIRSGWDKYEAKTNAVQVIMHSTGLAIDEVSESLEKLNEYTDETSYRFDQMVDAISKFTGAGLKLEDAEKAAEGIANWAATAGVSPEKAASAFYNLSQAMSSGALRAQDWKSIENLNMNTVEFEEKAIEVAKAMIEDGRASKEMAAAFKKANPQVQGFRDSLSSGWLDKDVMTEVFKEYADTTTEFGMAAFKAAQEAKTFRDAVDAAKEAVATGWQKVFEQIFGNYEEAKVFWTNVANEMIDFFSAPVNALANYLKEWHKQGGYVAFINSIHNAWASVKAIGEAVGEVFRNIFPALDPARLVRWTQKLEEVTAGWMKSVTKIDLSEFNEELQELYANGDTAGIVERLTEAEEHNAAVDKKLSPLKDTLQGIFAIIKLTGSLTKALFKIVLPFTKLLVPIANLVGTITGALGRMASAVADAILNSDIFNGILGFLAKVANAAVSAVNWLSEKLIGLIDSFLHIPIVETFVGLIWQLGQAIKNIAAPYIAKIASAFTSLYNSIKNFVSTHLDMAIKALGNVLMTIGGALIYAAQAVWKFFQPAFTALGTIFKTLYNSIKKFVGKFDLKSVFSDIGKGFDSFIEGVSGVANSIWNFVKPAFIWLENAIKTVYNAVKNYLESSEFDDILQDVADGFIAFGGAVIYAAKAVWDWLQPAFKAIGGFVSKAWEYIKGFGKKIKEYWDTVIVPSGVFNYLIEKIKSLAGSVKNLSSSLIEHLRNGGIAGAFQWLREKFTDLWKTIRSLNFSRIFGDALDLAKIGGIVVSLLAFYRAIKLLHGISQIIITLPRALKRFSKGLGLKRLATSILMLAGALYILSQIPADRLWKLLAALGAMAAGLVAFTLAMGYVSGVLFPILAKAKGTVVDNRSMKRTMAGLLVMALSIIVLSVALKKVSEIDKDKLWGAVGAVSVMLLALAAAGAVLSIGKSAIAQVGIGFLAMAASLLLMIFAIEKLQNLFAKLNRDKKALDTFEVVLLEIGIALISMALVLKKVEKASFELAAMIAAIGVAIYLIAAAVKKLAELSVDKLGNAGLVLLGLVGALALIALISNIFPKRASRRIFAMASTVLAISISMLILTKAIKRFGEMDSKTVEDGLKRLGAVLLMLVPIVLAAGVIRGGLGGFIGLAAVILVVVASLRFLSNQDFEKMLTAVAMLSAVMVSLGAALLLGSVALRGGMGAKLGIALVIVAIVGALWVLTTIPIQHLQGAVVALGGVFAALAAASLPLGVAAAMADPAALFGIALMIGAIGATLLLIGQLPMDRAMASALILKSVLITLTAAISIISAVTSSMKTASLGGIAKQAGSILLMIVALIAPLIGAIWLLSYIASTYSISAITSVTGILVILIAEMTGVIAALSAIAKTRLPGLGDSVKIGAVITAVLLPIVAALAAAKWLIPDPKGLITIATAIAELVLALMVPIGVLMAAGALMAKTGPMSFVGGLAAAAEFGGIFIIITAIFAVIGAIVNQIDSEGTWLIPALETAGEIAGAIGTAFGKLVGGLVGGIVAGIGDAVIGSLPDWGEKIGLFLEEIKTSANSLNEVEIDESKMNALESLATAILILTGSSILDGLTSWLTGGVDYAAFAQGIAEMGPALNEFATNTADIDPDKVEPAAKAIEYLADAAGALGREGGLWDDIAGKPKKMNEFADELNKSHDGFVDFANNVAPTMAENKDYIDSAGEAIGNLIEVGNKLKRHGGLWGDIAGEPITMAEFAANLAAAGPDLVDFGTNAAPKIAAQETAIKNTAGTMQALVDVANSLKPKEVKYGWGFYSKQAQSLGSFIAQFSDQSFMLGGSSYTVNGIGTNLKNFAKSVEGLTPEMFNPMIDVIGSLVNLGNALNGKTETVVGDFGGWALYRTSTEDLGTWLSTLSSTSEEFSNFANVFDPITYDNLKNAVDILQRLVTLDLDLTEFGANGNQFVTLANNLESASGYLLGASGNMSGIVWSELGAMLDFFSTNLEAITSAGEGNILEMLAAMVGEGTLEANNTANEVVDGVYNALKTSTQQVKFYNAGVYLVTGFINGIKSQITQVESMATQLSNRTITAMRRALRIESPSKVMRRIGDYTGEGFVLGIEDYIGASEIAGTELAESATNSAIAVLDYIQDLLNGDLSVDMTIRPVLDLSNVQSGVRQIDSMFSQRQAILAQADADAFSNSAEIAELVDVSWKILREIQNGRAIYLDGRIVSNVVNERLGRMEG